jgi:hypothetical protein
LEEYKKNQETRIILLETRENAKNDDDVYKREREN